MRCVYSAFSLLLLLSAVATGQEPVVRVRTNLAQIDLVVTDKQGLPVTDLRAEDFEVVEKGRTRPLEYCTWIPLTESRPLNSLTETRPTKNELRRTIVFIVSNPIYDVSISLANRAEIFTYTGSNRSLVARDAQTVSRFLRGFIDAEKGQMGPRDLAAIYSTDRDLGLLGRFTSDRELLAAAVEEIEHRALEAPPIIIPLQAGAIGHQIIKQNLSVLETLSRAIDQVKRLPGRKLVVLVSRGLFIDPHYTESKDVRDRLRALTVAANRAQISVYALNPRGLGLGGGGFQDLDSLIWLARETGGEAVYNTNDISLGFTGILRENSGYYLLGYDPGDEVSGPPAEVRVRVRRPGLNVRVRTSALRPEESRQAEQRESDEESGPSLEAALNTPFARREIGFDAQSIFVSPGGESARLLTVLRIDPAALTIKTEAERTHNTQIDLAWRVTGPDGREVKSEAKTYSLALSAEDFTLVEREGLPYTFDIEVDEPGFYQIDAAVRDTVSGRTGNATRFVRIPDLARRNIALSSLILSSTHGADQPEAGSPARLLRQRFADGDALRYRAYIYDHRRSTEETLSLLVQARIRGTRTVAAQTVARVVRSEAGRTAVASGDLMLKDMSAGLYKLELIVTDPRHNDSPMVATAEFEIIKR